jgi:hypothetical protein
MLSSLFGDLPPRRLPTTPAGRGLVDPAAAAVAALSEDVVVDVSPAEAVRAHFALHRQDLQRASAMITLLDPSQLWAGQVVHALADAAGQPVQRVNLRERSTLRTLAVIERTLVPRRGADALRVYHAEPRADALTAGLAQQQIGTALAEGSQLTAVIVGTMQPHALLSLLQVLLQATQQPEWRCPRLVFLLPPGATALRQRILEQHWPPQVQASVVAEPLACAASVWNRVLEAWEADPRGDAGTPVSPSPAAAAGAAVAQAPRVPPGQPAATRQTPPLPQQVLNRLLLPLARSEGLLACGIVDLNQGDLLASQHREQPPSDLAALALALCAARQLHHTVTDGESAPDEILVTTGARQTLLRRLPGEAALGFVAVLDRQQANLALLRFKLMDAERVLA